MDYFLVSLNLLGLLGICCYGKNKRWDCLRILFEPWARLGVWHKASVNWAWVFSCDPAKKASHVVCRVGEILIKFWWRLLMQ